MKDNYPIYFYNNTCLNCGSRNTIVPVNMFGSTCKLDSIYPIYSLKCNKCGKEFFILWGCDEDGFDIPIAVSKNMIESYTKVFGSKKQ